MTKKVYGIRCDGPHKRAPADWTWLCINGKPMFWCSLEDAQSARTQLAEQLQAAGVTYTATLYGILKDK
jgi:hypothetical protein